MTDDSTQPQSGDKEWRKRTPAAGMRVVRGDDSVKGWRCVTPTPEHVHLMQQILYHTTLPNHEEHPEFERDNQAHVEVSVKNPFHYPGATCAGGLGKGNFVPVNRTVMALEGLYDLDAQQQLIKNHHFDNLRQMVLTAYVGLGDIIRAEAEKPGCCEYPADMRRTFCHFPTPEVPLAKAAEDLRALLEVDYAAEIEAAKRKVAGGGVGSPP